MLVGVQTFKGAHKKFRKIPVKKIARDKHNAPKTLDQQKNQTRKLMGATHTCPIWDT